MKKSATIWIMILCWLFCVNELMGQDNVVGHGKPLQEILNLDDSLNIGKEYSDPIDPSGFKIKYDMKEDPLFQPENKDGNYATFAGNKHWDERFERSGLDDQVNAIVVYGHEVYVGGRFTNAGSISASCIVKWNGHSWSNLGKGVSRVGSFYGVNALSTSGKNIYAGGGFTSAGDVIVNNVAIWNGSVWGALGLGIERKYNRDGVLAIAVSKGDVYVGGAFMSAGSVAYTYRLARWNGFSWSALGKGIDALIDEPISLSAGKVNTLQVSGRDLYVGGSFHDAGGVVNTQFLAKWDGVNWLSLGSGVNATVNAIAVSGNDVYVGGEFTSAGGITASNVARWNTKTKTWSPLGSGVNAIVNAIAVSGNDVYVGGEFTSAGGITASNVARWNTKTKTWSPLGSGVNATVKAIAVSGNDVYVGGAFTIAGGKPSSYFGIWHGGSNNGCALYSKSSGAFSDSAKAEISEVQAYEYRLDQNYPNPFNPTTTIRFSMPQAGAATLMIYDILGRVVVSRELTGQAGWNAYQLDASRLSSGMYYYRLTSGGFTKTLKMLLVK